MSTDIEGKELAIGFFKWNAEKVGVFVKYLLDVKKLVSSNEIEENIVKFENSTIEERFDMYIEYLKNKQI
jgi:hypothetical protein